jgi:hypothetical protein
MSDAALPRACPSADRLIEVLGSNLEPAELETRLRIHVEPIGETAATRSNRRRKSRNSPALFSAGFSDRRRPKHCRSWAGHEVLELALVVCRPAGLDRVEREDDGRCVSVGRRCGDRVWLQPGQGRVPILAAWHPDSFASVPVLFRRTDFCPTGRYSSTLKYTVQLPSSIALVQCLSRSISCFCRVFQVEFHSCRLEHVHFRTPSGRILTERVRP